MSNLTILGDVYEQLLNLKFINPMIVRDYNNEYILVHIFSNDDVEVCKITRSREENTFIILTTNFQKDSVDYYEGDPVELVTDRFIEANRLDKLDCEALANVINRTFFGRMNVKYIDKTYVITCKSFRIQITVVDNKFVVKLYNDDYASSYNFTTGFEVFKFINYIKNSGIYQFSYNKTICPLLTLSMDLYLKFGDNVANEINTFPGDSIENTVVKLQSNNGYMAFSIDIFNGMDVIKCKIDRYDYKFYGEFKVRKYEDILDFIDREYAVIK